MGIKLNHLGNNRTIYKIGGFFMKNFWMLFLAILFTLGSVITIHYMEKDILFKGATSYTFYTKAASSQANILSVSAKDAKKIKYSLSNLTGESAEYQNTGEAFEQIKKYNASFKFMEDCGDIQNYYFYSPKLYAAVSLSGIHITLHVAIKSNNISMGSPLIFGGF